MHQPNSNKGRAQEAGWSPQITRMSDVSPQKVQWLWEGKIPLGKLTSLVGNPGEAKSIMTCDQAARVSTGAGWPDDPHTRHEPGGVVMLSAEDDIADTIRPRLDAAGADCTKIDAIEAMRMKMADGTEITRCVDLSKDIPRVVTALERMQATRITPKLLIIDPITAYLGDQTDSHKNAEVRTFLAPLAALAQKWNIAIVMVNHLNKGQGSALYRTQGSIAFVAAVRGAWLLCRDPENPRSSRRLLLPLKSNLAKDVAGHAFVLSSQHSVNGQPICEWEPGEIRISADVALAPLPQKKGPSAEALADAVRFLRSALAVGPKLATEVEEEADGQGISKATLKRARKAAKVKAYHPANPGPWWWQLSGELPEPLPSTSQLLEPLEPLPNFPEKTEASEAGDIAEAQVGTEAQATGNTIVAGNGHDLDVLNAMLADAAADASDDRRFA